MVAALTTVISGDTVLCSDSGSLYKPAGKTLGVTLRQIPKGSHSLGPYHIQNVNALHSRIKGWFRFFDESESSRSPEAFLRDALAVPTMPPTSPSVEPEAD